MLGRKAGLLAEAEAEGVEGAETEAEAGAEGAGTEGAETQGVETEGVEADTRREADTEAEAEAEGADKGTEAEAERRIQRVRLGRYVDMIEKIYENNTTYLFIRSITKICQLHIYTYTHIHISNLPITH
jgi:hypothetical protein